MRLSMDNGGMSALLSLRHTPEFRQGAREMASAALGIGAWGLVTGVAMVKSGLGVPLSLAMTLLVFAGSAQLASLPLIVAGAPIWLIWATATCVNLRFVIFSAGLRPYFAHLPLKRRLLLGYFTGDLNYIYFQRRFPDPTPKPGQEAYFWGSVGVNWLAWQSFSIAGILLANVIPPHWGLGYAGVLALLGITASLLTQASTWAAAGVAAVAAVAAYGLPLKLHIVVAIAAAIVTGLAMDRWQRGRVPLVAKPVVSKETSA